jgi:tetratricopeptide (TPR) repeat protein
VLSIVGMPWVLTRKTGREDLDRVARVKLQALEAEYAATPTNDKLFNDLARAYRAAGRDDDLKRLFDERGQRLMKREAEREKNLREMFAKEKTRQTASALIELLETQERDEEAVAVYREWLGDAPAPSALSGFSNWLLARDRNDDAREAAERATKLDPLVAYGHTFLGIALSRLERLPEAREELTLALLDDPEDDDARDALASVTATIGPLDASAQKALEKRFKAWSRDAGR